MAVTPRCHKSLKSNLVHKVKEAVGDKSWNMLMYVPKVIEFSKNLWIEVWHSLYDFRHIVLLKFWVDLTIRNSPEILSRGNGISKVWKENNCQFGIHSKAVLQRWRDKDFPRTQIKAKSSLPPDISSKKCEQEFFRLKEVTN